MIHSSILGIFYVSLVTLSGLHVALGSKRNEFLKHASGAGEASESSKGAFKNGKDKHAANVDEISEIEKPESSNQDYMETEWKDLALDEIMDQVDRVFKIGKYNIDTIAEENAKHSKTGSNGASEIGKDGIPKKAVTAQGTGKVPAGSEKGDRSNKKKIGSCTSRKPKPTKEKINLSLRKRISKFLLSNYTKKRPIYAFRPAKSFLEDFGKVLNEIRVKKQISTLNQCRDKTSKNDVEMGRKLDKSKSISSSIQKESRLIKNKSLRLSPKREKVELINFGKSKSSRESEISVMKEIREERQQKKKLSQDDGKQAEVLEKALVKDVDLITRGAYYLRHKDMTYLNPKESRYKDFKYKEKVEQICNQIWNRFVLPYNPQAEKFGSFPLEESMEPVTNVSFDRKVARKGVELGDCEFDGVRLKVLLGPYTGPQYYIIALPNPTTGSSIVQDCLWEENGHWVYRGQI